MRSSAQAPAELEEPRRTGSERPADRRPPHVKFRGDGLIATAANVTAISSLLDMFRKVAVPWSVILLAEHHVLPDKIDETSSTLWDLGWKSILTPAEAGEGAGSRGGTGVLVRKDLELWEAPGGEVGSPRVTAARIAAGGFGDGFIVYSIYLYCSEGMSDRNKEILVLILRHAARHKLPWLIGGDWNMLPEDVESSEWAEGLGGSVVAAAIQSDDDDEPGYAATCGDRCLDFFYASEELAPVVKDCFLSDDLTFKPHTPTNVHFEADPKRFMVYKMVKPKAIPIHPVVGPRPQAEPGWDALVAQSDELKSMVLDSDVSASAVADSRDALWNGWTAHVEPELLKVAGMAWSGKDAEPYLGRSKPFHYAWEPLLKQRAFAASGSAGAIGRLLRRIVAVLPVLQRVAEHGVVHSLDLGRRCSGIAGALKRELEVVSDDALAEWRSRMSRVANDLWRWAGPHGPGQIRSFHCREGRRVARDIADSFLWIAEVRDHQNYWNTKYYADNQKSWESFARTACEGSAAIGHRWTKVPHMWKPSTDLVQIPGTIGVSRTSAPADLVKVEEKNWTDL